MRYISDVITVQNKWNMILLYQSNFEYVTDFLFYLSSVLNAVFVLLEKLG